MLECSPLWWLWGEGCGCCGGCGVVDALLRLAVRSRRSSVLPCCCRVWCRQSVLEHKTSQLVESDKARAVCEERLQQASKAASTAQEQAIALVGGRVSLSARYSRAVGRFTTCRVS